VIVPRCALAWVPDPAPRRRDWPRTARTPRRAAAWPPTGLAAAAPIATPRAETPAWTGTGTGRWA